MARVHILPKVIVVLMALAFTAGVVGFAGFAARGAWRQVDAQKRFVPISATVLKSELRTTRGRKGRTKHRAVLLYEYTVDGRVYAGDRETFSVRFDGWGNERAEAVVAAHPVGSTMTVFVDPANPLSSVRRVGLDGSDLNVFIFLTPFLGASLFLWAAAAKALHRSADSGPGRWLRSDDGRTASLRLATTSPLMAAGFAMVATGFVAIFASLFALGSSASLWSAALLICGVLVAGTLGYWITAIRQAGGRCDLHIDRDMKRLIMPARLARKLGPEVPFETVRSVDVEVTHVRTKHGTSEVHNTVLVVDDPAGGEPRRAKVLGAGDQEEAERFAEWLREQIK